MIKNPVLFYVDDDSDDLMIFNEVASELGVEVKLFNSGETLMAAMQNSNISPDIIFIDLNMPGKSGYEVIAELRALPLGNGIHTVVLSTASDKYNIEKSQAVGADMYMTKFTSTEKLKTAIQHAIARDWFEAGNAFVYTPN